MLDRQQMPLALNSANNLANPLRQRLKLCWFSTLILAILDSFHLTGGQLDSNALWFREFSLIDFDQLQANAAGFFADAL